MHTITWQSRRLAGTAVLLLVWLVMVTLFVNHHASGTRGSHDLMEAAPELGILINAQMQVLAVDQGSSAARAGIQSGDILRNLGNTPLPRAVRILPRDTVLPAQVPATISSTASIRALFHALVPQWERQVTVVLERQGRVVTLPILITAQPYNYDAANPFPTVTPVPASLDSSVFYL